jgi:large subunit ribosomal protein L19e
MTIRLTKRIAADLLERGARSIRIKESASADAEKAITREDVRAMIKKGDIYAPVEKRNVSTYGKLLKVKRSKGRSRGNGRKRGTTKARRSIEYKKKIRAQRRVLLSLKEDKTINNERYKEFYRLVKGGTFQSKASLLGHIRDQGVGISDERYQKLKHI